MGSPLPGGSVYNQHRLSPSGPILSGQLGPIIQMAFDQVITSDAGVAATFNIASWDEVDLTQLLAAELPRDIVSALSPTNRCEAVLRDVRFNSLVAVWCNMGLLSTTQSGMSLTGAIAVEVGAVKSLVPWAIERKLGEASVTAPTFVGAFALSTLHPNPAGAVSDIIAYPVAAQGADQTGFIAPPTNQVAIIAAEIAQS